MQVGGAKFCLKKKKKGVAASGGQTHHSVYYNLLPVVWRENIRSCKILDCVNLKTIIQPCWLKNG